MGEVLENGSSDGTETAADNQEEIDDGIVEEDYAVQNPSPSPPINSMRSGFLGHSMAHITHHLVLQPPTVLQVLTT